MNTKIFTRLFFQHSCRRHLTMICSTAIIWCLSMSMVKAQCDTEVSGVFTYCNSFHMGNPVTGYFVAFRAKDLTGTTLNVIDINGIVPMNQGKRVNDINTQDEPANYSVAPLTITGVGADTLEFWYFGPYPNGSSFDIALVDPGNVCDTIFVASGTFDCADNTGITDPGACDALVPLYFLDFSQTEFTYGGGGGGNESFDDIFLIMSRSRESMCCDLQPANQRCFEFIVRLDDQDIGLSIDDVGSGSTGGEFYADTIGAFMCTGNSADTWPFTQGGGQSNDLPLCLGFAGKEFVVLSCKSGANVTGASVDAISNIFSPPEATIEPCNVSLEVFNVDSVTWSSDDDPTLANLISCNGDSSFCMFFYDTLLYGQVTACEGDTFVYIVGGMPADNECFNTDTILYDTTYVVVYPVFTIDITNTCFGDSLILTAEVTSPAIGCPYAFAWSNGDTTQSTTVFADGTEYFVTVTRSDLPPGAESCVVAGDSILAIGIGEIDCSFLSDAFFQCDAELPPADPGLLIIGGCAADAVVFVEEDTNNGSGCGTDTLIITRRYIVDFDGDLIGTTTDRDTCVQLLKFRDDLGPQITCPANVTISCTESTMTSNTGDATATDNCGGTPIIFFDDVTVAGTCAQAYTITRTFGAMDLCGNISTCVQSIAVTDTVVPVITCPADITIECNENSLPDATGQATAMDGCDGNVAIEYTDYTEFPPADGSELRWIYMPPNTSSGSCVSQSDCATGVLCFALQYTPATTGTLTSYTTGFFLDCFQGNDPVIANASCVMTDNSLSQADCGMSGLVLINSSGNTGSLPITQNVPVIIHQICVQLGDGASVLLDEDELTDLTVSIDLPMGGQTTEFPNFSNYTIDFDNVCGEGCVYPQTIYRRFVATDGCGNQASCTQLITRQDTQGPAITGLPAPSSLECPLMPSFATPTVMDACDPAPELTFEDVTIEGSCPQEYTAVRTWTATDNCGNSTTASQTISVSDNTAPAIVCPDDVTIECNTDSTPGATGTASATDICDGNPVVTFSDQTIEGICPQRLTINRTWIATDECDNSTTCVQVISVIDTNAPQITCPQDITVDCSESTMTSVTGDATATDNCDLTPIIFFDDLTTAGPCPQTYTITRTFGAVDDCGNSSSCVQTIQVEDITPPTINCPPAITIDCSVLPTADNTGMPTGTDACSGTPTFTFSDLTVAGTCDQDYSITRTWIATDACGNSSTCLQQIAVSDLTPPDLICPEDITIECDEDISPDNTGQASATDACDPDPVIQYADYFDFPPTGGSEMRWIYMAPGATSGSCVSQSDCATGTLCFALQYTPATTGVLTSYTTGFFLDCFGGADPVISNESCVMADNSLSQADCGMTGLVLVNSSGNTGSLNITANVPVILHQICIQLDMGATVLLDEDETTDLTTSVDLPGGGQVTEFPAFTNYTIDFDVICGNGCPYPAVIYRRFVATDDCGNLSTCIQSITREDTQAPVISTLPAPTSVECPAVPVFETPVATDNCDNMPELTFDDVTIEGACPQEYTVIRTWTATDACLNSATASQTISVTDNTAPVLTCPDDITIECNTDSSPDATGMASATDACDVNPIVDFSDLTVAGICPQELTITRTWTATDECDNVSSCVQTISVQDRTAPVIICPQDVTVDCTESTMTSNTGDASATDNCDVTPIIFFDDFVIPGPCDQTYMIVRTFGAVDDCGNSATCIQNIQVQDTMAPIVVCPEDITVMCANLVPAADISSVSASDNCGGATITFVGDVISNQTCTNRYSIARTYRATDACGNSADCTQTITVDDQTPPVIICNPEITVSCTAEVPPVDVSGFFIDENCGGQVFVTHLGDVISNQQCAYQYTITRTYQAADACGNTATCEEIIQVQDLSAPQITCPSDITLECTDSTSPDNTGEASATDNCEGEVELTSSDVTIEGNCAQSYTIQRTWVATDSCGNTATCLQTISIEDNTPPTLTCADDITIECTDSTSPDNTGMASGTDNCGGLVTLTSSDVTIEGLCAQAYTINRTWMATDECGNTATCIQSITIQDTGAPVISCPADVTIDCSASTDPNDTGLATATDACDPAPLVTSVDVTIAGNCPQEYGIQRTWTATDACGNTSTCQQNISVEDTTPPVVTCPAPVTVSCAGEVPAPDISAVTASDDCGAVTVTEGGDVITAQLCDHRFIVERTYIATDACGNSSTCIQLITVNDVTPPTISCPPNVMVDVQDSTAPDATGQPTVSDNCAGVPDVTFEDMIVEGECASDFLINRTFTATDDCGNTATCLQIIQVAGGCLVDLSLTKVLDQNQGVISGGDDVSFTITVSNEGEQTISSVTIIDYIPVGFVLNDPDWTPGMQGSTGQSATIILSIANGGLDPDGLDPGESVAVQITLQANPDILPGEYYNTAEIINVININGIDVTVEDADSTPDTDDTNDPSDEDDHDIAAICIMPIPAITGDNFVCPGELVEYFVDNYNPANDYIWTLSGGGTIVQNNGSSVIVQWQQMGGGPFQLTVNVEASPTCEAAAFLLVFVQGFESIACNDHVQISLDQNGIIVVTPGMILEGENELNNNYYVVITDQFGNVLPSDTIDCSYAGQTLMVAVHNTCNNQTCWGTLSVEDKIPPVIECPCPVGNTEPECEVNCLQAELLADGEIPTGLQPNVTDNCDSVLVEIIDTEFEDEGCGGGYIIVTWKATDIGGNTATCVQQFNIIPLTLETLTFPANYLGECGESVDPSVTGWPQIDGLNITDNGGVCNIFAGYWDKDLAECGGGRKIQRTWTVLDWCSLEVVEGIQIIKLTDTEGPALTCPANVTIGTNFWYCYANYSVPKPQAYDNCSEIDKYSLTASAGIVVPFGNNYVVQELPLGTHFIAWTVTDECGNSSTCSFSVTVIDDVAPVVSCDLHTIVSLTNDGPSGVTLVPASVFDDGSYDNCGPVTFRARRMDSCIDFDWTTEGACIDDIPGGVPAVNSRDRGTVHRPCVPFACCDVNAGPVMVELEVTDMHGNVNYCMVEAIVQDKISPFVECPPDISVSCDFWFNVQEGTFSDAEGNHDGSLDEDPLSAVFGNMFDAFRYHQSARQNIIINDPGNTAIFQPHTWGIDGWANDNCEVDLQVRVRVIDDCSGGDLPANAPDGAIKMIERRFSAAGTNDGSAPGTCTQRIWVIDYKPFFISDQNCNNNNPNDGVIWPCDVVLTTCPDDLSGSGEPVIFDDACSLIGVTYEDQRFDFVDGACFKILRDWAVIDWCQYNPQTGAGLWHYTQVIKVHDEDGPEFQDCPVTETLCVSDPGVTLPDNNQVFLGENNPQSTSCSVHLDITRTVMETCSDVVKYDVKIWLFNGPEYVQVIGTTTAQVDADNHAVLRLNTRNSPINTIRTNGLPYNSPWCNDYHRVLWSVEDGCGNWSHCEYQLRLEDCKQPTPVCINGLSTVVMPIGGEVTIWAKDFNASSNDDCTPAEALLYSFSGDAYQPSFTYTCDNVPSFGVELVEEIWVADGGVDHNCNGVIEWSERNKDYCTTTIVIMDNNDVCDPSGSILAGEILTDLEMPVEKVSVTLNSPEHNFPVVITPNTGLYQFTHVPDGTDYTLTPVRDDNHKNGVSTLDLVHIQKHLLGIQLFDSPYQYIAADANNSQHVSAIDLVEIRKLILGIYQKFPHNQSWRFVKKGYEMNATNPWPFDEQINIPSLQEESQMNNDFVGVKIGDVNHTAKASATQVVPRNGQRVLTMMAEDVSVEADENISVAVSIPESLLGFQWTIETDGIELTNVSGEGLQLGAEHVAYLDKSVTTMSWNRSLSGDADFSEGFAVITLEGRVSKAGKLSQMLRITSEVTAAEAYSPEGEILEPKLVFRSVQSEFELYQNHPNPWKGLTQIGFNLPEDGQVLLSVYDLTGKVLHTDQADCRAGYNSFILTDKQIPNEGVMYYRVESGPFSAAKKMILIK